jgi:uncharacterized protein
MRLHDGRLSVSPTDLANFLACGHKASLERLAAEREIRKPTPADPLAEVLRARGIAHEARYVDHLRGDGVSVEDLQGLTVDESRPRALAAMRRGVDVIVQAPLHGDDWFGVADVLRKVDVPSVFGRWSYEVHDAKLSRETRGGTILQLCVYSELLGVIQKQEPEYFRVVTPAGIESFRFDDFSAFYRQVKARFLAQLEHPAPGTQHPAHQRVPDPVDHCTVCDWFPRCDKQRRDADHLTFVAGLGHQHQAELEARGARTLTALATLPAIDFKPKRGARETYEGLRKQAWLQLDQRRTNSPKVELLPVEREFGLSRLPEPRPGDLFLDLEGDPFAEPGEGPTELWSAASGGLEYLFGLAVAGPDASFIYRARWAVTDGTEREAFETVMDEIMAALDRDPSIHVYHYAPYEQTAFKRLMGRYATREAEVDRLLRGGRFVDLYSIVRHALRAGVEHYSIKDLEPFYDFTRDVDLEHAGNQRRLVEVALETNDPSAITPSIREAVEGYNKDDCRSTLRLRDWLERLRLEWIAQGVEVPRPLLDPVEPSEAVSARGQRVHDLRARLLARGQIGGGSVDPASPWSLLAYLLDWHHREDKVVWWEYFRLVGLADADLFDERAAVAGLEFVERVEEVVNRKTLRPTGSVVDRYRYPVQETEIRAGSSLKLRDGRTFGEVMAADRAARTLDVRKGKGVAEIHPASAFAHDRVPPDVPAASVFRFGEDVAANGFDAASNRAAVDLLLRRPPRFAGAAFDAAGGLVPAPAESITALAVRVIADLDRSALPIQGPPGSGKTFTGARMICELVRRGKRVGVTGPSHKVIRNLLDAVAAAAPELGQQVRLGQKVGDDEAAAQEAAAGQMEAASTPRPSSGQADPGPTVALFGRNDQAREALEARRVDVLGGTIWLWAREDFAQSVDVLFVDEAGQTSLANAMALSHAASSVVYLGDPQQLEQPQKGSHPPGVDASALDHVLEGHQTMPEGRGLFLPVTWRLPPTICEFTSEVFYEGKLVAKPGLERQRLTGAGRFDGAGLFAVDVAHDGCRNASDEEVDAVLKIVTGLLAPGSKWTDEQGVERQMTAADVLVVAPYNAQVFRMQERLRGLRAGTVDKFQGQEAPVVIYSMATSRPEDAPRGMEFLYSLNRLNVATSRARCACILVASPRLFAPECRTPRQMRLANALARYRELARLV